MEPNKFEQYLKERYIDQINWYSEKAGVNKRFYIFFQWGVIILSVLLPVLISTLPSGYEWITLIVSIILGIGTAGLKTFKFQENWINYRTIAETLKKEKYFYDAGLNDYSNETNKESLFVERVESLISKEHSLWIIAHNKHEEEKDTTKTAPVR